MLQTRLFPFLVIVLLASLLFGCGQPVAEPKAPTTIAAAAPERAATLPAEVSPERGATLPAEAFPTARPPASPAIAATVISAMATVEQPKASGATAPMSSPTPERVLDPLLAATVNGVSITRETYERQLDQAQRFLLQLPVLSANDEVGQQALAELRSQVLNWLIDQMIIEQAAAQAGLVISDAAVEDQITRMRGGDAKRFDEWLSANGLTLAELGDQLRADLLTAAMRDRVTANLPRASEHIHVRHILLSEQATARQVEGKLQSGENFISLGRQYSEDQSTRGSGGDLGFVPRGVMPPEFDQVAFGLAPGEVSQIVESLSGYQVIQVVEIDPLRTVSDQHWPVVQQRAFENWVADQKAAADIVSMRP